jgi:hypothetical protein
METFVHETLSHPNLMYQLDRLEDDQQVTFVLPFMGGGDLLDAIPPEKGLQPDIAMSYSAQLLAAVACMHENGIAHRYASICLELNQAKLCGAIQDHGVERCVEDVSQFLPV